METSSYAEISWNGAADGKKNAATDKKQLRYVLFGRLYQTIVGRSSSW